MHDTECWGQDRREVDREKERQNRRNTRHEVCLTGWMHDRMDAGQKGYRSEGI